jgi:hypothetical protein
MFLSSIGVTLNFSVAQPVKEDQLSTQIAAAIRAAVQSFTQSQDHSEGIPTKDEPREIYAKLADTNLQRLETKGIPDEGWGQVYDLAGFINRLPKNQKRVVLRAIENGGQVNRAEVFLLIGRSEDKSLTGFTKPVARKLKELKDKEEIPQKAVPLLRPIYVGAGKNQRAQGFKVPMQVVVRMSSDLNNAIKH